MPLTLGPKRRKPISFGHSEDTDYGSHEFGVRDPEGHIWSFGT